MTEARRSISRPPTINSLISSAAAHLCAASIAAPSSLVSVLYWSGGVTLRAAAAKRYGGEIHDSSCCEFFMEAYGTRAVRAVAEVAAGWNGRGC